MCDYLPLTNGDKYIGISKARVGNDKTNILKCSLDVNLYNEYSSVTRVELKISSVNDIWPIPIY